MKLEEDTKVSVYSKMNLEIKEVRGSSTTHSLKKGYTEVSSETRTNFHWKLCGMASKLGPEVIGSDSFNAKEQGVYNVEFRSHGFEIGCCGGGFKTREDTIRNALEFAKRNGIKVDGYE